MPRLRRLNPKHWEELNSRVGFEWAVYETRDDQPYTPVYLCWLCRRLVSLEHMHQRFWEFIRYGRRWYLPRLCTDCKELMDERDRLIELESLRRRLLRTIREHKNNC